MNQIKIYVVSLKNSTERRNSIIRQFAGNGLQFEFFDAVYGKDLSGAEIESAIDMAKSIRYLGREMTRGEIGCALSHRMIYKEIIEKQISHAIILEDDARLTPDFSILVNELHTIKPVNCVIKLEQPNSVRTSLNLMYPPIWRQTRLIQEYKIVFPLAFISLASAYFIDIQAARLLISDTQKPFLLADDWEHWRPYIKVRILNHPVVYTNPKEFDSAIENERILAGMKRSVSRFTAFNKLKSAIRIMHRLLRSR